MQKYDTVIIGGGLSGIAIALRRHKKGDKVLLIEKSDQLGGKIGTYQWEEFKWDKGPSLFTQPHLITELFELFDKNPDRYFNFREMDENCRYFFEDKISFTFYKDSIKRRIELAKFFSDNEVTQVEEYLEKARRNYNEIGELFIGRPKLTFKALFKTEMVKHYPKLLSKQMLKTLNEYNESWFSNDKLIQLFNRFGTYNGSNPYQMSGLYSMIPHLELNLGTFFPHGGMRAIIDSLQKLMDEQGVEYRLNCEQTIAKSFKNEFVIEVGDGQIKSKRLISAIDHLVFYKDVYKDKKAYDRYIEEPRSTSALVFYWAIDKKYEEIGLHNMLFSEDYEGEFKQIFQNKEIPNTPSIYIHNSSVVEENHAPSEGQNWFVMINTPAGIEPTQKQIEQLRNFVMNRVKVLIGIDISEQILHEEKWTMKGIEDATASVQGALYGGAFNSKMSSFKRHGNQSKKNINLYFTGGSVHPGGGIPLVLQSAKIVDQLIGK